MISVYERWTWERCRERILSIKHRLGYGERLWILGFELLDDGRLMDPFHGVEVFDPAKAKRATEIPSNYSAVPEMYCLLWRYAAARERALTGEWVSPSAIGLVLVCLALTFYRFWDRRSLSLPLWGRLDLEMIVPLTLVVMYPESSMLTRSAPGMVTGFVIERRHVGSPIHLPTWNQVLKTLIGPTVLVALQMLMPRLFSTEPTFRFTHYALLGPWATLGAPYVCRAILGPSVDGE